MKMVHIGCVKVMYECDMWSLYNIAANDDDKQNTLLYIYISYLCASCYTLFMSKSFHMCTIITLRVWFHDIYNTIWTSMSICPCSQTPEQFDFQQVSHIVIIYCGPNIPQLHISWIQSLKILCWPLSQSQSSLKHRPRKRWYDQYCKSMLSTE